MPNLDNAKCKKHFDKFLALDKNEIIPFRVTFHLLTCAKCRTAVRSIDAAEKLLRHKMDKAMPRERQEGRKAREGEKRKAATPDPVVEAALRQIEEAGLAYPQMPVSGRVSFSGWIAGGIILVLCLAAFPFTPMGEWASQMFAGKFLIPFYTLMGLAVAVYAVIFTGSNMDFFVKRIEAAKKAHWEKT